MKPKYIILHHSLTKDGETVDWQAIRRYHTLTLGWRDIGYHWGVEEINGHYEILKGRMDHEIGAHCRHNKMNYKSLGICIVGNYGDTVLPPQGFEVLVRLVKSLMITYSIPLSHVKMHNHFNIWKSCPGKFFPYDRLIKSLKYGGL